MKVTDSKQTPANEVAEYWRNQYWSLSTRHHRILRNLWGTAFGLCLTLAVLAFVAPAFQIGIPPASLSPEAYWIIVGAIGFASCCFAAGGCLKYARRVTSDQEHASSQ